ncbi:hypothetical protein NZ698_00280 [Chryseobacterium sp. PBS4-4]|uniref:Uncharacterized protein n=1 Tax=Chryseobacterium edaphi TaxID=2976532 RepID=A0ABT2W039_9FLAO|nr:hypothetical protein [Chryseobacterium edaphi]MCU7615616.1 hypothetical protein [Chryseobacterium edaphi]
MLTPLTDGTYKELLFVYNFTPQEKQILAAGNGVDTKGKVTITELNKGTYNNGGLINKTTSWICGYVDETIWESCYSGDHNGSNVETWGSCDATATGQRPPKVYTISVYKCNNIEDPNNPSAGNPVATGPGYAGNPGSPAIEQPGTPSNCTSPGVLTGPQDPSTGTGSGGCEGVPTLPNLELGNSSTPCTQLQSLKNKTGFTDKMNTLKSNIPNGAMEKGFVLHDDSTAPTSPVVEGGGNDGNVSFGDYYKLLQLQNINLLYKSYGTAHNHLASNPEHIGIFTPGDLNELLWSGAIETGSINPFRKNKPENAIDIAITNIGLFAMKITDMTKLDAFLIRYTNMVKDSNTTKYDEFIEKFTGNKDYNIKPTSTYEQQVTGFLRFMQDEDLGIELYEGNKDTYGGWKKLELIDNGNGTFSFTKIPCNL